ncbi:AI-2E family transporter [bacterium]|nr:AI-2E family transporter [bacterium]
MGARTWWTSIGILTLGIAVGVGTLILLALFVRPLALFFLSVCIASALAPLVTRLARVMPRNRAILVIYGGLVLILVLLLSLIVPPLVRQIGELIEDAPRLVERAQAFLEDNGIDVEALQIEGLAGQIGAVGGRLITVPFSAFSGLLDALLVIIVSLYLLMDACKIENFVMGLFPQRQRERVAAVGTETIGVAGGYVRGVVINILVVSVITTIVTSLIGLPFAFALGIIGGSV